MVYAKIFIITFCYLLINTEVFSQQNKDRLSMANQRLKVAVSDVVGNWYSTDSSRSMIRLIASDFDVYIEGIRHGVNNYGFKREKDSMDVNGIAPNWPPYYCILHLIDAKTLEINFFQFHYKDTYTIIYKRD